MMTDTAGIITYVNPAFESSSGYPAREVVSVNACILKSGRHDADFYREL